MNTIRSSKMFFSTIEMLESLKNPLKQYDIMKLYRPASIEGFSSSSPENSGQRSVSYGHHYCAIVDGFIWYAGGLYHVRQKLKIIIHTFYLDSEGFSYCYAFLCRYVHLLQF